MMFLFFIYLQLKCCHWDSVHLAEAADNVGDEERSPAEEEDPHDDPHGDGRLVLLHQAVAQLVPHARQLPRPRLAVGHHPRGLVTLPGLGLHARQQLAPVQPHLHIAGQLVGLLHIQLSSIHLIKICYFRYLDIL